MSVEILPTDFKESKPSIIKVVGVGGGGSNAVNYMYNLGITGVDFLVCNTDIQSLESNLVPLKVQLGKTLTEGRGAGNIPEKGKQSAIEDIEEVRSIFGKGTKMIFLTVGMGGGTGTGAAPVIAKLAQEMGILTVAIVTTPFKFEGRRRIQQAKEGLIELEKHVDSLLVIDNDKLRKMHGDLTLSKAFAKADHVLAMAAKGIAEIVTVEGYINVDYEDVDFVLRKSGAAIMGVASAKGSNRAIEAVSEAMSCPLLNSNNIYGAKNILFNVISGKEEVTMSEIKEISSYIKNTVGGETDMIWGNGNDNNLREEIRITVVATGFNKNNPDMYVDNNLNVEMEIVGLGDLKDKPEFEETKELEEDNKNIKEDKKEIIYSKVEESSTETLQEPAINKPKSQPKPKVKPKKSKKSFTKIFQKTIDFIVDVDDTELKN